MTETTEKAVLADVPTPQACVYIGRGEIDGKPTVTWLPVGLLDQCKNADDAETKASAFSVKRGYRFPVSIGTVYVVDGVLDDTGRMRRAVPDWKFNPQEDNARHINPEWVAAWEARDQAAVVAKRARKTLDDLAKDKKLPRMLGDLRKRYNATDRIGRLALEVVVLDLLRHS
jgi:hypothetical protein